jgi:hypothetical protein
MIARKIDAQPEMTLAIQQCLKLRSKKTYLSGGLLSI